MNKCALCGKKFKNDEAEYGLSCLKRICSSIDREDVKGYRDEKKLNKKVCKELGKGNLPNEQSKLLTNRYYTLKLLEEVDLKQYDKYKVSVENDIHKIGITTSPEELKSFKKITLKGANEVNKHYKKYKNIFQKIKDGDYDAEQYITSGVIRFAFSNYYAKKPYLSDMIQLLQLFILKIGVYGLKAIKWDFASSCLEHSLEKNPKDIDVIEKEVIKEIKNDINFKNKINEIIKSSKSHKTFNIKDQIIFDNDDLIASLHEATIIIKGIKQNNKWYLDVTITDLYDFTELKKLQEYIKKTNTLKNFALSFGNNFAMVATSCNVVHKYNITIKFTMEI